jgi:hypothetical protein
MTASSSGFVEEVIKSPKVENPRLSKYERKSFIRFTIPFCRLVTTATLIRGKMKLFTHLSRLNPSTFMHKKLYLSSFITLWWIIVKWISWGFKRFFLPLFAPTKKYSSEIHLVQNSVRHKNILCSLIHAHFLLSQSSLS